MADKQLHSKGEPFYPFFTRPPNKFVRFEERDFDDGVGHTAITVIAHFIDKKNKAQEMTAFVKWNK